MKTQHLVLRGEPTCIFLETETAVTADGSKMPVDLLAPRMVHGRERLSHTVYLYAFCDFLSISLHDTPQRIGDTAVTTVMTDQSTSQGASSSAT